MTPTILDERMLHLDFLWRSLMSQPACERAVGRVKELDDEKLRWLLRHHGEAPVAGGEVEDRDDQDRLLGAYGELVVALIADYIPPKLDEKVTGEVLEVLRRPPVIAYYEQHYRILMPSLLRLHCEGAILLPRETEREEAWKRFEWFRGFAQRFRADRDLESFLWLLDAGIYSGYDLRAFLKFLEKPDEALAGVWRHPENRSPLDSLVAGMIRFFEFCLDLAEELRRAGKTPLLGSAIWFYYSYWFREFSHDVGPESKKLLAIMRGWAAKLPAHEKQAAKRTDEDVRRALEELTGSRYSDPLMDALGWKR